MTVISIVQLYPDYLNFSGDYGNVLALSERARLAGFEVQRSEVAIGDIAPDRADIIVLGNGPLSALLQIHADLNDRKSWIQSQLDNGAVLLAVGGGGEMLATELITLDGTAIAGLALIDAKVKRVQKRNVGYAIVDTPFTQLLGFEDHASEWLVSDERFQLGVVRHGNGATNDSREFIFSKKIFITNLQGPLLPLNPELADHLLRTAIGDDYLSSAATDQIDQYAEKAREAISARAAEANFKTMSV